MKELMKITDADFALLCYIKEVARKRINGMEYELSECVLEVVNDLLDKYVAGEEQ